jgi:predicted nucleotidyltransferase
MSLLTELHEEKRAAREKLRLETRARCREILRALLPAGTQVIVFGSLARPFAFSPWSDVDLAFSKLPSGLSQEELAARLEVGLQRPVDLVLLDRTRLKAAILRTGETWTL